MFFPHAKKIRKTYLINLFVVRPVCLTIFFALLLVFGLIDSLAIEKHCYCHIVKCLILAKNKNIIGISMFLIIMATSLINYYDAIPFFNK